VHLPDWLNPWWTQIREIRTPLDADGAKKLISDSSGFLKGPIGRVLLGKGLVVFRESGWHLRRPWVVAHVTVMPAPPGSIVSLRMQRTWSQAAFITVFGVLALGVPVVFFVVALALGNLPTVPWWTYPGWVIQDAAIYAAVMALNSGAARRDSKWLTTRIAELLKGTPNDAV
jgi:hypothetical protein